MVDDFYIPGAYSLTVIVTGGTRSIIEAIWILCVAIEAREESFEIFTFVKSGNPSTTIYQRSVMLPVATNHSQVYIDGFQIASLSSIPS